MNELKNFNTGLKYINERVLNDGVYSINPKTMPNMVFTITLKRDYPDTLLIEPLNKNANQFFFIKYNDTKDYYTIIALHSHQILGVEKIDDTRYENSYIKQYQTEDKKLFQWKIELIENNFFSFELKETNLNLTYENISNLQLVLLCKKSETSNQQFALNRIEIIETGYYCINSKCFNQSYITFKKKSDVIVSSRINNENNHIFWIVFDKNDGCYSIINVNNLNCISSNKSITQKDFFGTDSQKWIIGSYNISKKEFFIESKSSFFRISISKFCWNYTLDSFNPKNPENYNQIFYFQPSNINILSDQKKNELLNKIQIRYMRIVDLSKNSFFQNENELVFFFENCYNLEVLKIPNTITNIPKNTFDNCKRIKRIECDPKWLPLLPNRKNVEAIFASEDVKTKESKYFKDFTNLKLLELSEEFKKENCNDDIFKDISDLKVFIGDPIFMELINKSSLKWVTIPPFVKEIPEKAFYGCHFLNVVLFEKNSRLKIIKRGAFADCKSLKTIDFPESLENVFPDAFDGCCDIKINFSNDKQKFSFQRYYKIENTCTKITKSIEVFCNISNLEIPLSVEECEQGVLNKFKYLCDVSCDPKWLNYLDTNQISQVSIPKGVEKICKKDFDKLVHLNCLSIPPSVKEIEENSFSECVELEYISCATYHLKYFNAKQIKIIDILNDLEIINANYFKGFVNLKYLYLPKTIKTVNPYAFINCKKLIFVSNEIAQKFIINKSLINNDVTKIYKQEYYGWENLFHLKIPESVEEIEDGTFDNCCNIHYLECHPKWFSHIPQENISILNIPNYVTELKFGIFDDFSGLEKIILPNNIKIENPYIFDQCENLTEIICDTSFFDFLSLKTKNRCLKREMIKYNINSIQPDKTKIHDELHNINCDIVKASNKLSKEITLNELMTIDSQKYVIYKKYIEKVMGFIKNCHLSNEYEPKNTDLDEISNICGIVCHEIKDEIILRPVQILSILVLLNEVLNNHKSHGSIGEIKTGEGKSIIITILAIILVKYKHKVDIITTNMELAKRDQKNQSHLFKLFDIKTGVLFHKENDEQFMKSYIGANRFSNDSGFNIEIFKYPVVYSTNANFEFSYLHSLTTKTTFEHTFDVVLIDEVDSMFIDELNEPAIISENIKYAYYEEILKIVYAGSNKRSSEIVKSLNEATNNQIIFKENDIELLKRAAKRAMKLDYKIDYLVQDDEIIIIDQFTHYQKKGSRFNQHVHEMLHIINEIKVEGTSQPTMQITQHEYFNLYKKIIGVTGTIGSTDDEKLLRDGYNVNIFKFPRNYLSQLEIYLKKRPDSIQDIYDMASNEVIKETNKGRPVIVIWNSIKCAEEFICNNKRNFNAKKITAEDIISDRNSIKFAGNAKSITVATLAVGRGVDIRISNESLEAGGLHVIIPMPMRNQRSLEQAAGRAGRQGQPGSVSIYISNDDQYEKNPQFLKSDENLLNIELEFSEYIKTQYDWMLIALTESFPNEPMFPFGADYKVAMEILSKYIILYIKRNLLMRKRNKYEILIVFKNLSLRMIQLAWGFFFNKLFNDEKVNDYEYCKDLYNDFIEELNKYFPTNEKNAQNILDYLTKKILSNTSDDQAIVDCVKVTAFLVDEAYPKENLFFKVIAIIYNISKQLIHNKWFWQKFLFGSNIIFKVFLKVKGWSDYSIMSAVDCGSDFTYGFIEMILKNCETKFPKYKSILTNLGAFVANKLQINQNKLVKKKICYDNKIPQLTNDFIRKTMKMSSDIYEEFKNMKKTIIQLLIISQPYYKYIKDADTLYVVIKGTSSLGDIFSDGNCIETIKEINGKSIHFHKGFYNAATYVYDKISNIFNEFEKIYFIGHSYGASVASILCLLTKSNENFIEKEIYAMAFAPAPSMSFCPDNIADCIFVFINRNDPVPRFCAYNISKALDHYKNDSSIEFITQLAKKYDSLYNALNLFQSFIDLLLNGKIDVKNTQVKTVKGTIFSIGLFETGNLNECKILDEDYIGDEINLCINDFLDHQIDNYIHTFDDYFA